VAVFVTRHAYRTLGDVDQVPPIPAETEVHADENVCEPRERASAIVAIVIAFLLALLIMLLALWMGLAGGGGGIGSSAGGGAGGTAAGTGIGTGSGSGIGAGQGTGSGDAGSGPGAGDSGDGRMAEGPPKAAPPPGEPDGTGTPVGPPAPAIAVPEVEPPKFGFTPPDAPPPPPPVVVQPPTPVVQPPPGLPEGSPGSGASGTAGGGGTGAEFMGVRTDGRHIVYVIDRSGSMMGDRFLHTLLELKRSIERLPEASTFSVVFFSSGNAFTGGGSYMLMPPGRMMRANARNKREAVDWAESVTPDGGTDPTEALKVALQLKPDAIFLMTDGMFDSPPAVESLLAMGNPDAKVSINTIAFHERTAEEILKRIAAKHRGDYRFVPDPRRP
jgi:hypothetical protein